MRKHNVMPLLATDLVSANIVKFQVTTIGGRAVEDSWSITEGKYVIECDHCQIVFLSDRPHTLYHSKACRQAAYRIRKNQKVGAI